MPNLRELRIIPDTGSYGTFVFAFDSFPASLVAQNLQDLVYDFRGDKCHAFIHSKVHEIDWMRVCRKLRGLNITRIRVLIGRLGDYASIYALRTGLQELEDIGKLQFIFA